jgi:catechol 2,3-dioxygenase-like lactoylglutathione lyase family enzyme
MLQSIDHVVLTTRDEAACIDFYCNILNLHLETFGAVRKAFKFGSQKINVHVFGHEFLPKAAQPTPGSLDLCFIADRPLDEVQQLLLQRGVKIEEGPVLRTGARGQIRSIYVRDPDANLIEIAEYV